MEMLVMLDLLKETYNGKRVFLTGHTGFKGSWLLMILHYLGAETYGYALEASNDDLYCLINGDELCNSEIADIKDSESLKRSIQKIKPDFIFHLAAKAIVLDAYNNPIDTFATNVMGTVHLLDAIKSLNCSTRTLIVTTDKVYKNVGDNVPFKEEAELGGSDPYSNSKSCVELLTKSFYESFFKTPNQSDAQHRVCTARSGNVIGGGDKSPHRIMNDICTALKNEETIVLRNPKSVRPWLHVLDTLSAYLLLVAKLDDLDENKFQTINFGPKKNDVLNVEELTKIAINEWGNGTYRTKIQKYAPQETSFLSLDITKAESELSWEPRYNTEKAVQVTIDWNKASKSDARLVSIKQIKHYFSTVKS